jgi:hypothetical protein
MVHGQDDEIEMIQRWAKKMWEIWLSKSFCELYFPFPASAAKYDRIPVFDPADRIAVRVG